MSEYGNMLLDGLQIGLPYIVTISKSSSELIKNPSSVDDCGASNLPCEQDNYDVNEENPGNSSRMGTIDGD